MIFQGKLQKHQNFNDELNANKPRLDEVNSTGNELIEQGHYASEPIRQRLDEIDDLWQQLYNQSGKKGAKQIYSIVIFKLSFRDNLIKWVPVSVRPYVNISKKCLLQKYPVDSNQIW